MCHLWPSIGLERAGPCIPEVKMSCARPWSAAIRTIGARRGGTDSLGMKGKWASPLPCFSVPSCTGRVRRLRSALVTCWSEQDVIHRSREIDQRCEGGTERNDPLVYSTVYSQTHSATLGPSGAFQTGRYTVASTSSKLQLKPHFSSGIALRRRCVLKSRAVSPNPNPDP